MLWKKQRDGYAAQSGTCKAGIIKDDDGFYWQVTRDRGGMQGGIRRTLKEAKAAAEHATAHLNLLNRKTNDPH